MRSKLLLISICCFTLIIATGFAKSSSTTSSQATEAQTQGTQVESSSCTPIKKVYSEKNWQKEKPQTGYTVCPIQNKTGARETVHHFYEYRMYRKIATMKCLPGREGWFVPNPGSCATLSNESGLNWWAVNDSSGAEWVYQLLGSHSITAGEAKFLNTSTVINGGPEPSSFHNRLINHVIASHLSRSAWTASG